MSPTCSASAPLVNKVQEQLWGAGPYPPRTIIEVHRLNQDDIFEVEGTFYAADEALERRGIMRAFATLAFGALAAVASLAPPSAQTYPSRPVTVVVPFPAGGAKRRRRPHRHRKRWRKCSGRHS